MGAWRRSPHSVKGRAGKRAMYAVVRRSSPIRQGRSRLPSPPSTVADRAAPNARPASFPVSHGALLDGTGYGSERVYSILCNPHSTSRAVSLRARAAPRRQCAVLTDPHSRPRPGALPLTRRPASRGRYRSARRSRGLALSRPRPAAASRGGFAGRRLGGTK
jgi:hypothetical protein